MNEIKKTNDELKNFWNDEEKIKKIETTIINEEIEIKTENAGYIKETKEKEININFNKNKKSELENEKIDFKKNYKDDSDDENSITGIVISLITGFVIIYLIMNYQENEVKEEVENIKKEIVKKEIEEKKIISKESYKKENKQIVYVKSFKIKYEIIDKVYDGYSATNISRIINELDKIKSLEEDRDYEIEIVGSISMYGNLFYKIYKKTNSNKYDYEFKSSLENLKKIKFKEQESDVNFIIKIDNNNQNLN